MVELVELRADGRGSKYFRLVLCFPTRRAAEVAAMLAALFACATYMAPAGHALMLERRARVATQSFSVPATPLLGRSLLARRCENRKRCVSPILQQLPEGISGLSRADLELVLRAIEETRDWVSTDIAAAAMHAAREQRSLNTFIAELQAEVSEVNATIAADFELLEINLEEQASALATERRQAMAERATAVLEELEALAPPFFKARNSSAVPPQKSPFLPRGARIQLLGGEGSACRESLRSALTTQGYAIVDGPSDCAANFADPTLPPSYRLRSELKDADALVVLCAGAVGGGVRPNFLACLSRVLPSSLRRLIIVSPRGVDRTTSLRFAIRNALGGLDAQRASADQLAAAARVVGAASTTLFATAAAEAAPDDRQAPADPPDGGRLAAGDALDGEVSPSILSRALCESLGREEAFDARFSVASGGVANGGALWGVRAWDDEFLKLRGPEIARFVTSRQVPREWAVDWARRLRSETSPRKRLSSAFTVVELPTRQQRAALKNLRDVEALPAGARLRFLASGVEFVDANEEERVKGDFDGAIDLLVEQGRVRVVRAEMEPVYRRGTDGSRILKKPLVKMESENKILRMLREDIAEFE